MILFLFCSIESKDMFRMVIPNHYMLHCFTCPQKTFITKVVVSSFLPGKGEWNTVASEHIMHACLASFGRLILVGLGKG